MKQNRATFPKSGRKITSKSESYSNSNCHPNSKPESSHFQTCYGALHFRKILDVLQWGKTGENEREN